MIKSLKNQIKKTLEKPKTKDVTLDDPCFIALKTAFCFHQVDVNKLNNFLKRYCNLRDILILLSFREVYQALTKKAYRHKMAKIQHLALYYGVDIGEELLFFAGVFKAIVQARNLSLPLLVLFIWQEARRRELATCELEEMLRSLANKEIPIFGLDRFDEWSQVAWELGITLSEYDNIQNGEDSGLNFVEDDSKQEDSAHNIIHTLPTVLS